MAEKEILLDSEAIRSGRITLGMTQETFAEKINLSQTHVSQIEQGKKAASLKAIMRIAQVLGVDFKTLILNPPQPPAQEAGRGAGAKKAAV